jgi:hypothetical protein
MEAIEPSIIVEKHVDCIRDGRQSISWAGMMEERLIDG